jgi:hypothetical protein
MSRGRETHVVILDNMSSHKTQQTRMLFETLSVPFILTALASLIAVPVESVFKYMKQQDFRESSLPDSV